MDYEILRKKFIEEMPDFISNNIKEDIANIMIKIMNVVEKDSTIGTLIALDVLKDMYKLTMAENIKGKYGSTSELYKKFMAPFLMDSDDSSETLH